MTDVPNEIDDIEPDDQTDDYEVWDAFWEEATRKEAEKRGQALTKVIRGVTVKVPHDIPMSFEFRAKKLKNNSSDEAFAALLADLFGASVLDTWISNGMGGTEFRVVLHWGLSNGKGKPTSFREAYDYVMAREQGDDAKDEADDEGKASPQRSGASGGTGARSKRTSTASTGSSRKTSRR